MHDKDTRQKAILDLVTARAVATQAGLRALLKARGIVADQATLSRDIKELGLVKVNDASGRYRYATVDAVAPPVHPRADTLVARLVRSAEVAGNLVVVKTDAGEASPVGLAFDRLAWPEIAGTVAGDDTLIVVVRDGSRPAKLAKRIMDLTQRGGTQRGGKQRA